MKQQIRCSTMQFAMLALAALPAFAETPKSPLYAAECRLKTESPALQQFHALVHYPHEFSLQGDGLIVGIEKSDADQVIRGARLQRLRDSPDGVAGNSRTTVWMKKLLQQGRKAMFVSHAFAYAKGHPVEVFNAYATPAPAPDAALPDDLQRVPWLDCDRNPVARHDVYADSWHALDLVRNRIRLDLRQGGFRQVLVLVMGWNTNQEEAMQNFNSLLRNLKSYDAPDIAPYVVGITWPSQWDSSMIGGVVRAASLGNKGNDADEIGGGWLGAILETVVLPEATQSRLPVWAIGHSFGARALSHALCRGSVLLPPGNASNPVAQVDWLINLQGAYSFNRYRPEGAGAFDLAYAGGCPGVGHLLFTATSHDVAAETARLFSPSIPWTASAGVWERAQAGKWSLGQNMVFSRAKRDGTVPGLQLGAGRFHYVETSELMRFEAYGTGGGAHSDIYRPEIGRFLRSFLAPPAVLAQEPAKPLSR